MELGLDVLGVPFGVQLESKRIFSQKREVALVVVSVEEFPGEDVVEGDWFEPE